MLIFNVLHLLFLFPHFYPPSYFPFPTESHETPFQIARMAFLFGLLNRHVFRHIYTTKLSHLRRSPDRSHPIHKNSHFWIANVFAIYCPSVAIVNCCCNSFYFYIKPQPLVWKGGGTESCNSFYFYIKPQPMIQSSDSISGCNSFYFYIKPQLLVRSPEMHKGCNSFYFYIKPQLRASIQ